MSNQAPCGSDAVETDALRSRRAVCSTALLGAVPIEDTLGSHEKPGLVGAGGVLDTVRVAECVEFMATLPNACVDAAITDLPYAMTENAWDTELDMEAWWKQVRRVCKGAALTTASQPFASLVVASNLGAFKYEWIWRKSHPSGHLNAKRMPMRQHEAVLVFDCGAMIYNPQIERKNPANVRPDTTGPNKSSNYGEYAVGGGFRTVSREETYPRSVVDFSNDIGRRGLHPTQKPIELMRYLVRTYTNPGDVVLDMCCGSGTTLLAAKQEGRHYIGCDREAKYVEIARERLASEFFMGGGGAEQADENRGTKEGEAPNAGTLRPPTQTDRTADDASGGSQQ